MNNVFRVVEQLSDRIIIEEWHDMMMNGTLYQITIEGSEEDSFHSPYFVISELKPTKFKGTLHATNNS